MNFFTSLMVGFYVLAVLSLNLSGQKNSNDLIITKVDGYTNVYSCNSWYFSGQPNFEQINYFAEQEVETVVNLRSNDENRNFSKDAFSEENLLVNLGINYITIPVKGREGYSAKNLKEFSAVLNDAEEKVLIYCKGAGRVTYFMMAYLIKEKGFSKESAKEFGGQITYFSPIDALLGE